MYEVLEVCIWYYVYYVLFLSLPLTPLVLVCPFTFKSKKEMFYWLVYDSGLSCP